MSLLTCFFSFCKGKTFKSKIVIRSTLISNMSENFESTPVRKTTFEQRKCESRFLADLSDEMARSGYFNGFLPVFLDLKSHNLYGYNINMVFIFLLKSKLKCY